MRQGIFDVQKQCEEQRYAILERSPNEHELEKIFLLQEAEVDYRQLLSGNQLESTLTRAIDGLLSITPTASKSAYRRIGSKPPGRIEDATELQTFPFQEIPIAKSTFSHGSLADHGARLTQFAALVMDEIDP